MRTTRPHVDRQANLLRINESPSRRSVLLPSAAHRDNGEVDALSAAEGDLLGESTSMCALRARIKRVALASAPVLIRGESGSGKELVARAIHREGSRTDRPFVTVNVAAIPEELLETELFGHVRGAFSGANQARPGLFAAAAGGTLLLDEIGDMPLGLQAKLLRALDCGEVRAVGADRPRALDVRVVAATHRDLAALIADKHFREDLFFRLNVLPVLVAPLREHREDIPALVSTFVRRARARMPASVVRAVGPQAIGLLTSLAWPGNVRELANLIERLVVLGTEEIASAGIVSSLLDDEPPRPAFYPPFELATLRKMNERYVAWVLAQTGGNKRRAADILGIDLSTLYRWQAESAQLS